MNGKPAGRITFQLAGALIAALLLIAGCAQKPPPYGGGGDGGGGGGGGAGETVSFTLVEVTAYDATTEQTALALDLPVSSGPITVTGERK